MAPKRPEGTTSRPSKVRFVMIEAELNENNSLSDLTMAITQALRPSSPNTSVRVLPPASRQPAALTHGTTEEASDEIEQTDDTADEAIIEGEVTPPTPKTPRPKAKMPLPSYLHDLDTNGKDITFKAFAEKHSPPGHMKRYLVAAAWFKDHGNSPTVTIHKMYTAYKTAGWPLSVTDWDSNFRNLVQVDKMRSVAKGEYAINPLGEADLQSS